jgi:hypothetical protein
MRHEMRHETPLAKGEQSPRDKVAMAMKAFKEGRLRGPGGKDPSGRPLPGPVITNRKQAIAIALSQNGLKKRAPDVARDSADERVAGMVHVAHGVLHRAEKARAGGASDPHVAVMMPHVKRLLGTVQVATPRSRLANNDLVANHKLPLAQILG